MKENKFTAWVKAHKTELLIAGGIIATAVGAVILVQKWDKVKPLLWSETKSLVANAPQPLNIVNEVPDAAVANNIPAPKLTEVHTHLRNLPQGYHPSARKIAEASENGIPLGDNQTVVSSYFRSNAA